jgi:hypothetical protein
VISELIEESHSLTLTFSGVIGCSIENFVSSSSLLSY